MPGREKPLHLQSVSDLWVTIIIFPVFLGTLFGTFFVVDVPEGKQWQWLCTLVLFGAFFGFLGTAGIRSRLSELTRRGQWVPPGATRRPALVGVVLGLFFVAGSMVFMVGFVSLVTWLTGTTS